MSTRARPESNKVFLFVNPKSGGRVGEVFLQAPQPFNVSLEDEEWEVSLLIYSLEEGKPGNKPGFHALRQEVDCGYVVRCIVGGGDGTVMWVVGEAERHGINPKEQMHIGIVPLGTGNDFSQHLGWGGTNPSKGLLSNDCELLEKMVRHWCKARPAMHDVWQLSFKVHEDGGSIYQKEEPLTKFSVDTPMLLYCGIAKDAEVAYQVEMHRTRSQWCNKLVYALMGLRTMMHVFCCRGQRVRRVIGGMYAGLNADAPSIFEYKAPEAQRLKSNPEMLLFLNIDSIAGGKARRLWDASYRLGVRAPLDPDLLERGQDPGDGKLEVITLRRLLRLVMPTNNILAGRRVFQGAPIHVQFRSKKDLVTFLQVDGESYKLENPDTLTIQPKQQISVLHAVGTTSSSVTNSIRQLFNCTSKPEVDSPTVSDAEENEDEDEDSDSSNTALHNGRKPH
eukprot:CAMPEP_0175656504 /NCGR_PEP_ID=MMETSP0097-20121207/12442_1 /TAXON_ID=311494 /ORGANISM="Alexandrium monilatum, Strain CCMP3105" /LENGTH=448 /DNA_ID=CAMNT_0016962577 /DNA_START=195 /DNA_END=1541 /DNA_ORIENTATION=+